ncbi:MAG: sel1 repeat family protein [Campylobacteraceae bacterium]|nr:sel1 repeat family protein [Campylobacteraceae bacterium]
MKKLLTSFILISLMTISFTACEEKKPLKMQRMDMTAGKYFHYKKADMDPRLKRYPQAEMMYEEAGSSPASAFDLGNFYTDKIKDYDEAIMWYERAHEKDYEKAANNIGMAYEDKKDYDNAIKWYEIAILKEDKYAYFNLALMYKRKLKDYPNAIKYYKMDIKTGSLKSIKNLGLLYAQLNEPVKASAYLLNWVVYMSNKDEILKHLRTKLKYSEETITKGYELQLTIPGLKKRYKGGI